MITVPELAAEALGSFLTTHISRRFGSTRANLIGGLQSAARLALECIGNSDALYHNVEHTMLVTLVGYDIMKGRSLLASTSASDYAHLIAACLFHDIGFVRGILTGDGEDGYVIDADGGKVKLPRGSSDAALMPYHVERSKLFVMDRLGDSHLLDAARISRAIEFTRFPVPELDDQFHETDHGTGNLLADSSFVVDRTRSGIMAGWRQAVALAMTGEEIEALTALSRSRTEPAGRVSRAAMLLGYREKPSFFAVGRRLGVHHQTVQRCVERAMAYGALAALDDRPRPGKEPTITPEAKAWLVSLACDKAKEHGYPHELWTTRLLARHARERGPAAGHQCLARLAQGTVCKLLGQEEIKPHKVRYYLERRDAEFEPKMAEVLCVYREVQVLKKAAAKAEKSKKPVAIVSYDEKPGIQAIATTTPDLPPVPGRHASFARDHEYKRHGTLSLLAGIDLLTGKVHTLVRERHRSREFIEFLKLLDAAYPASTAIKLILDNHSAHISRETRAWLDTRPPGRFDFTFTPKHGSWLNLIEGFFSKFARSVLRHIRVTSKHELKQRIIAGIDDVNRHPVIHTWSYKLAEAA